MLGVILQKTNYSKQNQREKGFVRTKDIKEYIPSKQEDKLMYEIEISIEKALKKYHKNVGFSFEGQENLTHIYLLMRNKPTMLYGVINNQPITAKVKVINGVLFSLIFQQKPKFLPNEIFFGTIKERKSKMVSNIKHGEIIKKQKYENVPVKVMFEEDEYDEEDDCEIIGMFPQEEEEVYVEHENINDILYQQYEEYWDGYMLAEYYNDTDYYG